MISICRLILISLFVFTGCDTSDSTNETDSSALFNENRLLDDLRFLSSDDLEGRKTGSEGNRLAREFILERFEELQLEEAGEEGYNQVFSHTNTRTNETFDQAVNLIGRIEGNQNQETVIAITAHYDHLGVRDGEIYNGADDNASGSAALLTIAEYFQENRPRNTLLFIAFDAEEQGLAGARHFINEPPLPLSQILLNVNMDMISHNFENELYAVGTYHYPFLRNHIEQATENSPVQVLFGYDSDAWPQNWTMSSDHGPFHSAGIPFVYFGVVDHPHYHEPTDIFDNTNPEFYIRAVETIIQTIEEFDKNDQQIAGQKERNLQADS